MPPARPAALGRWPRTERGRGGGGTARRRLPRRLPTRSLFLPQAQLLSSKPMDDPLESIMYITSVGVPSVVYETVKNLRQARG